MTDYEKLNALIEQARELCREGATASDPKFKSWQLNVRRFLSNHFGSNSLEHNNFRKTHFVSFSYRPEDEAKACKDGLLTSIEILNTYLTEISEEQVDEQKEKSDGVNEFGFSRVFIAHGHDGELKEAVARLIERQEIEAIILSEKANQGRTIIEKFENYSDVSGAICLFTADDLGKATDEEEYKSRARQNVVFETGFFIGKLGRSNVIIIADSSVEMPSDLSGVVYTNKANWQLDIIKELKAIGYNVDANKLL